MPNEILCSVCFKVKCDDEEKCNRTAVSRNKRIARHNYWIRVKSGLSQAMSALRERPPMPATKSDVAKLREAIADLGRAVDSLRSHVP
jgi:hypothetical protein